MSSVLPPEEDWIPGHLDTKGLMSHDDQLHIYMRSADAYPVGIMFSIVAMFRRDLDLDEQRNIGRQVTAHQHDGDAHTGPRLYFRTADDGAANESCPDAHPWAHRGYRRIWTMGFWSPANLVSSSRISFLFTWKDQQIRSLFEYSSAEVSSAVERAHQPWDTH